MARIPVTLNGEAHSLYYSAANVVKALRQLRAFGRLEKNEGILQATLLVGASDDEAIAVMLLFGLEHERTPGLTVDRLIDWLDDVKRHRQESFFEEIQGPILEALKASGQITYDVRPTAPKDGAARPTESVTSAT
jgi:hypothetical protein